MLSDSIDPNAVTVLLVIICGIVWIVWIVTYTIEGEREAPSLGAGLDKKLCFLEIYFLDAPGEPINFEEMKE